MINKLIILLSLIPLAKYSYSQNNKLNTITVEGKSQKSIKPDLCFISMTFEKTDTSLKRSMDGLNKNIKTITNIFKNYSIDTSDIRIAEYSISSQINDDIKRKEYSVKNELNIDIKYNRKLISALLSEIQNLNMKDLDMNLEYGVSDSLNIETRKELKIQAIRNAKKNAEQISKELNLDIIGVKSVSKTSYNPLEIETDLVKPQIKFTPPVIQLASEIKSSFENYDVEDVTIDEDILITFETK